MLFWILTALLTLMIAASLLWPLLRPHDTLPDDGPSDVALYRDQLAEIDRDIARGTLNAEEAERTRTEISRRLLAASKSGRPDAQISAPGLNRGVAVITTALILAGGFGGYVMLGAPGYPDVPRNARIEASAKLRADRPSQSDMMSRIPPRPVTEVDPEYLAMVERLRAVTVERPNDLTGLGFLARHEAGIGNYPAALTAQRKVIEIKGDDTTDADRLLLLDLMVYATGGYISPEAETIAKGLLDSNPANMGARYYMGLLYDQTDRPDIAFNIWSEMIENGAGDDPYIELARRFVEQAAQRAGEDYTLPAATTAPGPTAEDMENAADMSPEDRQAMIQSMVDRLAERLATEGGEASDWARLIGALGVTGDRDRAEAIWQEAQKVFAARPDDLALIRAAAEQNGLSQ